MTSYDRDDYAIEDDSEGGISTLKFREIADRLSRYFGLLFAFRRLLFALLVIVVPLSLLCLSMMKPVYLATAVIGPPGPSPVNSMISSMGVSGTGASIARRIIGGSNGGGKDPFQEYQLLLQTPRLMSELVEKDGLLQIVFPSSWDGERRQWRAPSLWQRAMAPIKRFLGRPAFEHPDVGWLSRYLDRNLTLDQATVSTANSTANLMSLGNGFMTVSLRAASREECEKVLTVILRRADEILRQEQLRDVEARIAYINHELPNITQADQKATIIQILAAQEEIRIMTVADKRFAYDLVSGPYASETPISPVSPVTMVLRAIGLSLALWVGMVVLGEYVSIVGRITERFKVRRSA